jgi:hypothetical protein
MEDDSIDSAEQYESKWLESPFAVGRTRDTWEDEGINGCSELCRSCRTRPNHCHIACTACLCRRTGAGRVGNMVVLRQTTHMVETRQGVVEKPRLCLVLGPYFWVTFLILIPICLSLSTLAAVLGIPSAPWYITMVWSILNCVFLLSLFSVACSDPGILYRHSDPPFGSEWVWSDQAQTYRPPSAMYDSDCGVVLEGYDHTVRSEGGVQRREIFRHLHTSHLTCLF